MLRLTLLSILFLGATALSSRIQSLNRLSEQEEQERLQKCGIVNEKKVFNGDHVKNFTFVPYAVALGKGFPDCTGTLISKRHILTAAHCAVISDFDCTWRDHKEDFKGMEIVLRSICSDPNNTNEYCSPKHGQGALLVTAKRMILPKPYYYGCSSERIGDIMIIELENDIENEEDVGYACVSPNVYREGFPVRISGYGRDDNHTAGEPYSGVLKTYTTNITACSETDQSKYTIFGEHICSVNNNYQLACGGDSGSGVISKSYDGRDQVQGILVAGVKCFELIDNEDHYRKNPTADILTSTFNYLDWICLVTGICPRQIDREMVADYLRTNRARPYSKFDFVLLEQI